MANYDWLDSNSTGGDTDIFGGSNSSQPSDDIFGGSSSSNSDWLSGSPATPPQQSNSSWLSGSPQQPSGDLFSTGGSSQDDVDDLWGTSSQQQTQPQQDLFQTSSDDLFGSSAPRQAPSVDIFNQQGQGNIQDPTTVSNNDGNNANTPREPKKLSSKMLALILVGVVIFVILLVVIISNVAGNIRIAKKPTVQTTTVTQQTTQQQPTTGGTTQTTTSATQQNGISLVNVPMTTVVDYTKAINSTTGTVSNKVRYLLNNEVIYCIQIDVSMGSSITTVNYFCGYNVFNAVSLDDIVTVQYQQVSDTCYSVNNIQK